MHSRKSLLFSSNNVWIKQQNPEFDVVIGEYDGAKIYELLGLYVLNLLSNIITSDDVGLYRDDGLVVLRNTTGPDTKRTRKIINYSNFKKGRVTNHHQRGLFETDFLNVALDLKNSIFQPYRKSNDTPLYMNSKSNYPINIKRSLPIMIGERISLIVYQAAKKNFKKQPLNIIMP